MRTHPLSDQHQLIIAIGQSVDLDAPIFHAMEEEVSAAAPGQWRPQA